MSEDNKWSQPEQPPPQLFLGKKERDLTKQINDELIERVIGQNIVYFPLNVQNTNFHPLYGEAIKKVFLKPILIKALIKLETDETKTEVYGLDKDSKLTVKFHRRRLTEDQNMFVREGDIVFYGTKFYEIVKLSDPRLLFGQIDHKFEIIANCQLVKPGFFDEPVEILQIREKLRDLQVTTQPQVEEVLNTTPVEPACGGKIQFISGKRTSAKRSQFLDYANNPQDYKGCIIYLADIDEDEVHGNFDQPDKFFFNEGGVWIESPLFTIP